MLLNNAGPIINLLAALGGYGGRFGFGTVNTVKSASQTILYWRANLCLDASYRRSCSHRFPVFSHERAKRVFGRLDFWSKRGAGTEVRLTGPALIAYAAGEKGRRHAQNVVDAGIIQQSPLGHHVGLPWWEPAPARSRAPAIQQPFSTRRHDHGQCSFERNHHR